MHAWILILDTGPQYYCHNSDAVAEFKVTPEPEIHVCHPSKTLVPHVTVLQDHLKSSLCKFWKQLCSKEFVIDCNVTKSRGKNDGSRPQCPASVFCSPADGEIAVQNIPSGRTSWQPHLMKPSPHNCDSRATTMSLWLCGTAVKTSLPYLRSVLPLSSLNGKDLSFLKF